MNRLATLIAALVAALTLTAAPAMGDEGDPVNGQVPPSTCLTYDPANEVTEDPVNSGPCPPSPVQTAGDKPADRSYSQHKRSCKTEAKKWSRQITVTHVLERSNDGASWWQQETRVGDWFRVFTPRGCQLRHNEWKRNHRGQVDGKAVRR